MRRPVHFITAASLALCQRCPRLLAFQRHRGAKNAWRIGIEGQGCAYGSIFHKRIARPFFEAASLEGTLQTKLAGLLRSGPVESALEWFVRENFFNPLLEELAPRRNSRDKILAMATGTALWIHAMAGFLSGIPSLRNCGVGEMSRVFIRPEQRLCASYVTPDRTLSVAGCYDALLFNPDRGEATLFEFKGYRRSDIAVPLSQSLIYAWLLWKSTGVLPAIQVLHLEEDGPDFFSNGDVRRMMSGLPGLFETALDVLSRSGPVPATADTKLCFLCPFREDCDKINQNKDISPRTGEPNAGSQESNNGGRH